MSNQFNTPVLFLVFNRPDTTSKVFAAIRDARPAKLYVAADGPREGREGEAEQCLATREIASAIDWECEFRTLFRDRNLGCKDAVSSAITWFFEHEEEGIVLEDDCLPHPSFFPFCQEMLDRYRDDERVMMIGGTNYLLDKLEVEESYFFSRYFAIWGWATWRRAWRKYDITMQDWPRLKVKEIVRSFYSQPFMWRHMTKAFDEAHEQRINTWDIQWFYSCLFNNGLSIIPRINMISNIGMIGTHTSGDVSNNFFPVFALDTAEIKHPQYVYPYFEYDDAFFRKKIKKTVGSVMNLLVRVLKKRLGVIHV